MDNKELMNRVEIAYSDIDELMKYVEERGSTIGPCGILLEETALMQIKLTLQALVDYVEDVEEDRDDWVMSY